MVGYSSFVTPNGNVVPQISNGRYAASFASSAVFTAGSGSCSAGEYRQYVKGAFAANGSPVTHVLCGPVLLDPATYREDGCPPPVQQGSIRAYGYRSGAGDAYDTYTPLPRASGCQYQMFDSPGFNNVQPGVLYSIDLSFKGVLIDMSHAGQALATKEWTVRGQLAIVEEDVVTSAEPQRGVPLDERDRLVGAHRAVNLENGKPEVHIVIARPPGRPPLDAKSCRVEVRDADGAPIPVGPPEIHEVGNWRSATATIVVALVEDKLPVTAQLVIGNLTIALGVVALSPRR